MNDWNARLVADRFTEAADVSRRLPRVRVQGYFNVWPSFVQEAWEGFADPTEPLRATPPSPQAIERMLEAMRWVQWLALEQRHLIWLRAKHYEWQDIGRRCGCHRVTAYRRWQQAVAIVVDHLNAPKR